MNVSHFAASLALLVLPTACSRQTPNQTDETLGLSPQIVTFQFQDVTYEGSVSWRVEVDASEEKIIHDALQIKARGFDRDGNSHRLVGSVHIEGRGTQVSNMLVINEAEDFTGITGLLNTDVYDLQNHQYLTSLSLVPTNLDIQLSSTFVDAKLVVHPNVGTIRTTRDPNSEVGLSFTGALLGTDCSVVSRAAAAIGEPARVNLVGDSHPLCAGRFGSF